MAAAAVGNEVGRRERDSLLKRAALESEAGKDEQYDDEDEYIVPQKRMKPIRTTSGEYFIVVLLSARVYPKVHVCTHVLRNIIFKTFFFKNSFV